MRLMPPLFDSRQLEQTQIRRADRATLAEAKAYHAVVGAQLRPKHHPILRVPDLERPTPPH